MPQRPRDVQVRPGTEADLDALTDIYNHFIHETAITFDTVAFTSGERVPWLRSHPEDGPHRLLVAQAVSGAISETVTEEVTEGVTEGVTETASQDVASARILGYATSSPFRPKAAYSTSVEVSVYCAPDALGLGIGTLLYEALFDALKGEDVHRAYAGIALPNDASARLHTRFGFRHIGTYHEVGRKFGRYWDVAWYEKRLGPEA
jgi:phosphinothricin acetyltransferase